MGRVDGEPVLGVLEPPLRRRSAHHRRRRRPGRDRAAVRGAPPAGPIPTVAAIGLDLTFRARTQPYGLRRGTMRAGRRRRVGPVPHPAVGHLHGHLHRRRRRATRSTAGSASATTRGASATTAAARCGCGSSSSSTTASSASGTGSSPTAPRVYTDGCWAGTDGSDPIPIVDFTHDLEWIGADGDAGRLRRARRGDRRAARHLHVHARGRAAHHGRGRGHVRPAVRAVPPRRPQPDAGAGRRRPDGHRHLRDHRRPPPSLLPRHDRRRDAAVMSDQRPPDRRHARGAHRRLAHRRAARVGRARRRRRSTAVEQTPVGTGQMCDSVRLAPDATTGRPTRPATVVAKLPAADETSRATALSLRSYENEVRFYQQLAPELPIRTPHVFHADIDVETASFVLLLEDLAPAEQGDQLAGCTPEVAKVAVDELVRLHAPRWDDPTLADLEWLAPRPAEGQQFMLMLLPTLWDGFRERYAADLGPDVHEAGDALFADLEAYLTGRHRAVVDRPRRLPARQPAVRPDARRRRRSPSSTGRPCTHGPALQRRRLLHRRRPACADDRRDGRGGPRPRLPRRPRGRRGDRLRLGPLLARLPPRHLRRADHGGRREHARRAHRPRRPDVPHHGRRATPGTPSTSTPRPSSPSDRLPRRYLSSRTSEDGRVRDRFGGGAREDQVRTARRTTNLELLATTSQLPNRRLSLAW